MCRRFGGVAFGGPPSAFRHDCITWCVGSPWQPPQSVLVVFSQNSELGVTASCDHCRVHPLLLINVTCMCGDRSPPNQLVWLLGITCVPVVRHHLCYHFWLLASCCCCSAGPPYLSHCPIRQPPTPRLLHMLLQPATTVPMHLWLSSFGGGGEPQCVFRTVF